MKGSGIDIKTNIAHVESKKPPQNHMSKQIKSRIRPTNAGNKLMVGCQRGEGGGMGKMVKGSRKYRFPVMK